MIRIDVRRCSKMLFSSIFFIFTFLPILMAVYFMIPSEKIRARNAVLLTASLIFYSWGEPVYVVLMIFSIVFNWYMSLVIERKNGEERGAKGELIFTVIINLLIMGFFKYFGFLMDSINFVLGTHIKYTALALPIGISFYTFQALSYVFDVYRGTVKGQKNVLKFGLYLSLFPQLIAGPIVKYRDVAKQLSSRECTRQKFGEGASRFIFGLSKKVILANNLGALYSVVTSLPHSKVTVLTYWIGITAYTFQIYFDFSGYSDMAIGLGRMFGFEFLENFNYPYISRSVTEFWRRWHMSLSTWFREYVYIPLGGNRVSKKRHIVNLLIVWSLTGLWHGAAWNFVLWGTYFGIILIVEKYLIGDYIANWSKTVQHAYTIGIVVISWVFFSRPGLKAVEYLGVMFGIGASGFADSTTLYLLRTSIIMILISAVCSTPRVIEEFNRISREKPVAGAVVLMVLFLLSVSYLVYSSYNPFLYFRF